MGLRSKDFFQLNSDYIGEYAESTSNGESGLGRYDVMMVSRKYLRNGNANTAVAGRSMDARGRGTTEGNSAQSVTGFSSDNMVRKYASIMEPDAPTDALPAILMEFKLLDPRREKSLKETAVRALQQIEDRQYESRLLELGYPKDRIMRYGFGFSGEKGSLQKR